MRFVPDHWHDSYANHHLLDATTHKSLDGNVVNNTKHTWSWFLCLSKANLCYSKTMALSTFKRWGLFKTVKNSGHSKPFQQFKKQLVIATFYHSVDSMSDWSPSSDPYQALNQDCLCFGKSVRVPSELWSDWKITKKKEIKICESRVIRPPGLSATMAGETMLSFWELQST